MKVRFTYRGRDLGEADIPALAIRRPHLPEVFHFACPHCGDIWGAVAMERAQYHFFASTPCRRHGGTETLLIPLIWQRGVLRHVPSAVLRHEVLAAASNPYRYVNET